MVTTPYILIPDYELLLKLSSFSDVGFVDLTVCVALASFAGGAVDSPTLQADRSTSKVGLTGGRNEAVGVC